MTLMTPKHLLWEEFTERLEGSEGCNFYEEEPGDFKSVRWKCAGGKDKSFAKAILESMSGINIEDSLEFFERHGGYCDCEILFNVAENYDPVEND